MARVSLASARPDLAAEWHPTLNDDLTPSSVTSGSGRSVWWRDKHDHERSDQVAHVEDAHGARPRVEEDEQLDAAVRGHACGRVGP